MNEHDTERLLRYLDDRLAPDDAERLKADLAASPRLRDELNALQALRGLLRTTVEATAGRALQPFFTDRLLRRLRPDAGRRAPEEEFAGALIRWFRPVALAGLLVILALGVYNLQQSSSYDAEQTTTEAVLSLPPVTLATAYGYDL